MLRVEARGYGPREITFVAAADLSLEVALERQATRSVRLPSEAIEGSRTPAAESRRVVPSPKKTSKSTGAKKRLKLYDDI